MVSVDVELRPAASGDEFERVIDTSVVTRSTVQNLTPF
jgi:hypothetical protein